MFFGLFDICFHRWIEVRRNTYIYYKCEKCGKTITYGERYI